ncbi:MAG: DUF3305 domain-containing protein [Alphaproteobacteria bacterium]
MTSAPSEIRKSLPVGVIAERRRIAHPWQEYKWLPVAVIPGAGPVDEWIEVGKGDNFVRYHIATLAVELFRVETEAYKANLSNPRPAVYVVLREPEDEDDPVIRAVFATVSPYEAQDYMDTGEDIVEAVTMPDDMIAWVQAFIDMHHEDIPFKKRKRKNFKEEERIFGKELSPVEKRFFDPDKLN